VAGLVSAMSSKVSGWVWDQDLSVQRKCVLLWLAERATDNGVCFPGQHEIRRKTGLSESMVRRYLHWLASDQNELGQPKRALLRIIERPIAGDRNTSNVYVLLVPWARPDDIRRELNELRYIPRSVLRRVGGTDAPQGGEERTCTPLGGTRAPQVGGAGAREEPSPPDQYPELPPGAPVDRQQQGEGVVETTPIEPFQQLVKANDPARVLVEAFYRGLGAGDDAVTVAIRRRDAAIARQLVTAGATPAEAEAYARDTSAASGRIAPVDLRSFERERLGWLARRRGKDLSERRVVDRTGQPPSWETQPSASSMPPGGQVPAQRLERATIADVSGIPGLSGNQLAGRLRTLFAGGGQ
jgi:hypothetical protein